MAACLENTEEEKLLQTLYLKIAQSDVVIKSQQKDEPDFTLEQKLQILGDILSKSPATFLMRFGKFLSPDDLVYFEKLEIGNYELEFRMKELRAFLDEKKNHVSIQNRRYEAMRRLSKDSEFFNENEMRKRNPLMYEQYVGQYLTDDERMARDKAENPNDPLLSDILLQTIDSQKTEWIFQRQREREEGGLEEEEEEDDEKEDEECGSDNEVYRDRCVTSPINGIPNEVEKQLLREEFLSEMQAKFLSGNEEEFDYTKVDMNDDYDDLTLRERDEEEAYFDDDTNGDDVSHDAPEIGSENMET